MNKHELVGKLEEFKVLVQKFHQKRWDYTINIPPEVVEDRIQNNPNYLQYDLGSDPKLKNAILWIEYSKLSRERKSEVYNVDKSKIKQIYGGLKWYIYIFWEKPVINQINCYDSYFLNDWYKSEENSFTSIISDIDIMIGKIEVLSDKDFQKKIDWNNKNFWKILNPIWWFYCLYQLLLRYKFWTFIVTFIVFVIWILFTKGIEPIVDHVTKPLQTYSSWIIQYFK